MVTVRYVVTLFGAMQLPGWLDWERVFSPPEPRPLAPAPWVPLAPAGVPAGWSVGFRWTYVERMGENLNAGNSRPLLPFKFRLRENAPLNPHH